MKRIFFICFIIVMISPLTIFAGDTGKVGTLQTTSCGYQISAAIDKNNNLWVWGENYSGLLGDNGNIISYPIMFMKDAKSVYMPKNTSYAAVIKTDDSLWTWGTNDFGQLGDKTTVNNTTPKKVMDDVEAVSLGFKHTAAIKKDGSLWVWGLNNKGQVGNNTQDSISEPQKIMDHVVAISAGKWFTAAIDDKSNLWMWGDNQYGQFGDESLEPSLVPKKVMTDVSYVQVCEDFTVVVKNDGTLWAAGTNQNGQLGFSSGSQRYVNKFTQVPGISNVKRITLGYRFGLAVTNNGELWGWGSGGALGEGLAGYTGKFPQSIMPVTKITNGIDSTSSGHNHSLILKQDGTLLACGYNYSGALGNGISQTNDWTLTPTDVSIEKIKTVDNPNSIIITDVSPNSVKFSSFTDCKGVLIVASYKNGVLCDVYSEDFSATSGENKEIAISLDTNEADKMSAFIWNSMSDILPLCKKSDLILTE